MSDRAPLRLLIKAQGLPSRHDFAVAGGPVSLVSEPLMPSIEPVEDLGLAAPSHWRLATLEGYGGHAWDACHALTSGGGLGLAASAVEMAEPDIEQGWRFDGDPDADPALAAAASPNPEPQDPRYPREPDDDWFRDDAHGQFRQALAAVGTPAKPVRIAHLDTGYDPGHGALPAGLRADLARNFVEANRPHDAADRSPTSGPLTNRGHGMGTLSILAGRDPADPARAIGAAPFAEVVPIRVANGVVLFSNSAIAKALDYAHALCADPATAIHIVTMSMGGLASHAWADAVNALYDAGVFVVTAAGNNYGQMPTRNIVFPARFRRVVAACGAMADGRPYADLGLTLMAGNHGPRSKMATAVAAFTPNLPWARIGAPLIVDHTGGGTSSATPQIAATAALWIAKHRDAYDAYPPGWRRVEAVRAALFGGAEARDPTHFGRGVARAMQTLAVAPPAATALKREKPDTADFSLLRVLTGLGLAAAPGDARQRMLELEALQLSQSEAIERLLPDPEATDIPPETLAAVASALAGDSRASEALKRALAAAGATHEPSGPARGIMPGESSAMQARQLARAMAPSVHPPKRRRLNVYAYDPSLGAALTTLGLNETVIDVRWEALAPGPVGEYLEVVDMDPASRAAYAPVDLDHPHLLSRNGLAPTETDPRFHQQMVYAIASRTIEHFERALGRVALWAPRRLTEPGQVQDVYVPRLRIYPHALRQANAFYSPDRKALLFGYFTAGDENPAENAPGALVFAALSHDIVAHETSHALLDGLHRRYIEPTNADVLAFHEAFADIVALFQHFTLPQALKDQIRRTRGDLHRQNLLGQLAVQFGHAIGGRGALRDAIGEFDKDGKWRPRAPATTDDQSQSEPHARGSILVAAVFDAFLQIYGKRTEDLIRLAMGGSGLLGDGALSEDLVERMAQEAAKSAGHCLRMCIRALDYCPPVDITFGDYLRALVTADRDAAPEDPHDYRVAFVSAFRARGITADGVRALSPGALAWEPPPEPLANLHQILSELSLDWTLSAKREDAFVAAKVNAARFHDWLVSDAVSDDEMAMLGLVRQGGSMSLGKTEAKPEGVRGKLGGPEVHSLRPAQRVGPDGQARSELIVEITQTWRAMDASAPATRFRGGCTLVIDLEKTSVLYLVRKRVDHQGRYTRQAKFQATADEHSLRANYFDGQSSSGEPFAVLHQAR
jgi:hypothetical protein